MKTAFVVIGSGKITKDQADYKEATVTDHNCHTCFYMHDDGSCGLVEGQVKPDMVCKLWKHT